MTNYSELLLSSAERYAALTAMAANISGEQSVRQSRSNIGKEFEDNLLYALHTHASTKRC